MDEDLKSRFIHTIFQYKKLTAAGFGIDSAEKKSEINMTELLLMKGISDNSIESEQNVGLPEIRDYLSISKAAVSQMLGSLEKKGYIYRDIDKNNRRNLIVTLTPKGRVVLTNNYSEFSDNFDEIINYIGEEDIKQLIRIVNRIIETIPKLNNEKKDEYENNNGSV